jgi:branched-chain amino acid transport system substrate-binding protein
VSIRVPLGANQIHRRSQFSDGRRQQDKIFEVRLKHRVELTEMNLRQRVTPLAQIADALSINGRDMRKARLLSPEIPPSEFRPAVLPVKTAGARLRAAVVVLGALLGCDTNRCADADTLRIGFVTTLTTPARSVGEDLRDGFLLGLDQIERKAGDVAIEAVIADDAFSPDVGLAATKKLIETDKVDILAGYVWSNILIPASEFALASNKIVISANAGPSLRAGKGCHPSFFNVSFQNGQLPAAIGRFISERGGSKAYVMAPDYAAGLDMAHGFKLGFTGKIVGVSLTRWNPDPDTDFQPIFAKARAAGADVVFAFYPGRPGFEFLRQYKTSGLVGDIALATSFTVDAISLRSLEEKGAGGVWGMLTAVHWAPNLEFDQNKRFVAAFHKQFGRIPSSYAAQSYDLVFLLKAALEKSKGAFRDTVAFRKALGAVQWPSTRGPVKFGRNQFLRQNLYLATVVAGDNGWTLRALDAIERDATDAYASECSMPD